jgi:hypothetical protein
MLDARHNFILGSQSFSFVMYLRTCRDHRQADSADLPNLSSSRLSTRFVIPAKRSASRDRKKANVSTG